MRDLQLANDSQERDQCSLALLPILSFFFFAAGLLGGTFYLIYSLRSVVCTASPSTSSKTNCGFTQKHDLVPMVKGYFNAGVSSELIQDNSTLVTCQQWCCFVFLFCFLSCAPCFCLSLAYLSSCLTCVESSPSWCI